MSGGVDSSVTAALLKEQGYRVTGVTMRLSDWAKDPSEDARRVAEVLDIPFHVFDFKEAFRADVIDDFAREYGAGRTPNPCALCNQRIKFGLLMQKAMELGADFLATGHYARCEKDEAGRFHLRRGADEAKDQSYFLFSLTQERLSRVLFPLGGMTKPEVRALAERFALPVAHKSESQEICFIVDNNYVRFLEEETHIAPKAGKIVDRDGKTLGEHQGFHRYTIGQRKGLGLSHPTPLFVLGVNAARNEVTVGDNADLLRDVLRAEKLNWIAPTPTAPFTTTCKIRYRHAPVACEVIPLDDGAVEVRFFEAQRAITPGQVIVFYEGDDVLGGGWIA